MAIFRKFVHVVYEFIESFVISASFFVVIYLFLMQPHQVKGSSMYPTLKNNQILIGMATKNFQKNDVVVANIEDNFIVKRIKYTAGEHFYYYLNYDVDSPILINKDFYEHFEASDKVHIVQENVVENNKYYLIGDNLNLSDDSRRFGCVDKNSIKYKIIFPRL